MIFFYYFALSVVFFWPGRKKGHFQLKQLYVLYYYTPIRFHVLLVLRRSEKDKIPCPVPAQ